MWKKAMIKLATFAKSKFVFLRLKLQDNIISNYGTDKNNTKFRKR